MGKSKTKARNGSNATNDRGTDERATDFAVDRYGEYMSGPDFQKYVGIGPTTAGIWRRDGYGPKAFLVGKRWRYSTRDVVRFVLALSK